MESPGSRCYVCLYPMRQKNLEIATAPDLYPPGGYFEPLKDYYILCVVRNDILFPHKRAVILDILADDPVLPF